MTVRFNDAFNEVGKVTKTEDGYTVANVKCVRTGIQQYTYDELGFMGSGVANVYRAPEDVFHKDSLQSFIHKPLTIGHPREAVTANNWKDFAVGEVSTDVIRDGEWLKFSLIVKDKSFDDSDYREVSAGYNCDLIAEDGIAPCGTHYQFKQTNIRGNHVAFVPRGRAGHEARIGDGALNWGAAPKPKEVLVTGLKIVTLGDNEAVNIAVDDAAKIEVFKTAMLTKLSDSEAKVGELTAQLADAKAKILSDSDIELRVADRLALLDAARKVFAALVADGKSSADIKREVVAHKFGDAVIADMSDAAIDGMFKVATTVTLTTNDQARNVLKDKSTSVNDFDKRQADAVNAFLHPKGDK